MERRIFAIGDNGLYKEPEVTALYAHIKTFTVKEKPRVCLIPTASGDAQFAIDAFHEMFGNKLGCETSALSLFRGEKEDIASVLLNQDLIYVSGGNTRNMLVLWKEWGVDQIIRKAYEQGIVLAGGSAGSLCWFQGGVTDSIPERFSSMNCLGFLKGSNCPHYNELTRRPYYLNAVKTGELSFGYAAENGVGFHFVNESLIETVSAYEGRSAYKVEKAGNDVTETPLLVRQLTSTKES
jgi:peptidase E